MELLGGLTLQARVSDRRPARRGEPRQTPAAPAGRPRAGPCGGLPASRHQAGEHPARRSGPSDPDRLRRLARGRLRPLAGDDRGVHAGLRRRGAVHRRQAGTVDRHLWPRRHAAFCRHGSAARQRGRPRAGRCLRAARRRHAAVSAKPAGRHRCRPRRARRRPAAIDRRVAGPAVAARFRRARKSRHGRHAPGAACRSGCVTGPGRAAQLARRWLSRPSRLPGRRRAAGLVCTSRSTTTPPPAATRRGQRGSRPVTRRRITARRNSKRRDGAKRPPSTRQRRLRAEAEARRKADEETALRRKIEDEVRQKAEAEQAAKQHAAEEAKQRADAEMTKANPETAEAAETALHLALLDRQRLQVHSRHWASTLGELTVYSAPAREK